MAVGPRRSFASLALACAASAAFCAAFFSVKRIAFLGTVSPFVEDPYDAVGSFAIQIALAAAAVSVMRAIVAHRAGRLVPPLLVARGEAVVVLSILVTALADLLAMLRHTEAWHGTRAGGGVVAALVALIVFSVAGLPALIRKGGVRATGRQWARALAIVTIFATLLALYPDTWRGTLLAAFTNAASGLLLVFVATWALARILLPGECAECDTLLEEIAGIVGVRALRRGPWRYALGAAIAAGIALCAVEVFGEGPPASAMGVALLFGVILILEGGGVVLGFLLFRRYLALA